MTDLDRLIERARSANVDRGEADRYVRELDRWARSAPAAPPRRWVPWLAGGLAAAAAVLVVLWWRGGAAIAPVQIGNQVAILAAPGTAYRVVRSDPAGTEIAVEHGAVTARLWRIAQPHRLVLSGGGVTAAAVGTVYSLAVGADGPVVGVVEGTVEVRAGDGLHVVHAGSIWPPAGHAADPADARALLALAAPVIAPAVEGADAGIDAGTAPTGDGSNEGTNEAGSEAGSDAVRDAISDAAVAAPHPAPATAPAIKDRWRTARLLRGQGRFDAAVTECLAIADARDPTWSPIALVEAARIELGPLADPERAIALADRAIREWPADALVAEARELRCRALRQLGRGEECTHAPPP
jgi:hypothetical protein